MPFPWLNRLGLVATLLMCAVPLFVGLDRWDLRNDEAIYSYAVERMLDTGDWMTPRYIPTDYAFREKPPLKMWLVAGLMKTGLVPRDELGMRVLDAVIGTIIFAYVFAFGVRLAGPVAGAVAVLILFTFAPLLFDHGLRSNNMDGALMLAYTGGLWHALLWADTRAGGARHKWLATGYFVLGFMTKYVAVLFLPVTAVAAWIWRPGGIRLISNGWRQWVAPAVVVLALVSPWFIHQSITQGWPFWNDLLLGQVYERFTTGVDPTHLEPWHFYLTETWRQLGQAGSSLLVAAGLGLLGWRALAGMDHTARLLVLWWTVPVALISISSSKLIHYAFPFLPPVAVAGGLAAAAFLTIADRAGEWLADRAKRPASTTIGAFLDRHRRPIGAAAIVALAMAVWTLIVGPVNLHVGETRILRNSSVIRPAIVGALLLVAAGGTRWAVRGTAVALLLTALPIAAYPLQLATARSVDRPLGALASCLVEESAGETLPGTFVEHSEGLPHPFYYYLRHAGPWQTEGDVSVEIERRVLAGDPASLVLLQRSTWETERAEVLSRPGGESLTPLFDAGLYVPNDRVLVVPARYWKCLAAAVDAGGRQMSQGPQPNP